MPRFIIKLEGAYLEWSTISDSPASYAMTLDELRAEVKSEYGENGLRELVDRLTRVEAKGTSARDDDDVDDTIWCNRAGPKEKPLHREEIIEFFVRRKKSPTAAELAEFRKGLERCGPTCPQIPDPDGGAGWCRRCWGTGVVRPAKGENAPPTV